MTDEATPDRPDSPGLARGAAAGLLVLVLIAGAGIRLRHLDRAGPFVWDDAVHLLEGRWVHTGAVAARASAGRWLEERRTGEDRWKLAPEMERLAAETRGIPLSFPRPAFAALVALAHAGTGGADWSGALVTAIAGIATLPLVAWIGWRLWGPAAGLLAAAALALCGYHVAYSRIAFAESPSVLLATAAVGLIVLPADPPASGPPRPACCGGSPASSRTGCSPSPSCRSPSSPRPASGRARLLPTGAGPGGGWRPGSGSALPSPSSSSWPSSPTTP